jgi:cytochrome c-type biogenesis protein
VSGQLGLGAAFVAGLVSFLSPCVLPMVPGYASFLARLASVPAGDTGRSRSLVVPSVLFVAGFTAVFVVLGSTASLAGMALAPYRSVLSRAAGLLIVCFGVLMLGVIRAPWLYREYRVDPARARGLGTLTAPAMGAAFAFGWTPCVGPILGSILMLAGSGASVGAGATLLLAYSLGLGVPFVLFAVFLGRLGPALRWLERHSTTVSRVGGVVLIAFGGLLLTGMMQHVAALVGRFVPFAGG